MLHRLIEVRDPTLSHAELEAGRQRLLERLYELEAPEVDDEDEPETAEEGGSDGHVEKE